LTKTATAAALAVGLVLAGSVVTPADAGMRNGSGFHGGGGGFHGGSSLRSGHGGYGARYAGGYGGYGGGGYGGYGYGYGGCPLSPIGLITGYC
jgi:hypothetical protein